MLLFEPHGVRDAQGHRDRVQGRRRPFALYDLSADPQEENNLIESDEHPPKVNAVATILAHAIETAVGEAPDVTHPTGEVDKKMAERLKAIGYLGK